MTEIMPSLTNFNDHVFAGNVPDWTSAQESATLFIASSLYVFQKETSAAIVVEIFHDNVIIPWSIGWINDVEFAGTKWHTMFPSSLFNNPSSG